ncbi:ATPase, T2SS/T4P/T4SS family [Burkholderia cepacia]|uniref:ATPase, T2SS/T4P/T4SS family n=1 Tax=Burkholderia cepacia TaxID=292 RepID=UPI002ABE8386|nr:ATPase, T2SS/T4P/T4SS family [Burkholderia cepacia]
MSPTSSLPELTHVSALPKFRRLLCTGEKPVLAISEAARGTFVAIELQAGIALVIATPGFLASGQYFTYLDDLAGAHLIVREQMQASEETIAQIYAVEREQRVSPGLNASRAANVFRDIVEAAHGYGATDIALEPRDYEKTVPVRFRVNGDMYTYDRLPRHVVLPALTSAYGDLVLRNTNSHGAFQPSDSQSAMIPLVIGRDIVNLRWQSAAMVGGFDVALRLLDGNVQNYAVMMPDQMGYSADQIVALEAANRAGDRITVVSGETGSGKSTLLRALSFMAHRDTRGLIRQFAVNEPSEYPMPWLSDKSIQRKPDDTDEAMQRRYAEVIRELMRMDPDDLTIGEIRDRVVAQLAIELAMTGHQVRTTIHAANPIEILRRLAGGFLRIAIDDLTANRVIHTMVSQKLVPVLCPDCKRPARDVMTPAELELVERRFGIAADTLACRDDAGCPTCRRPGLTAGDGKPAGGTIRSTIVAAVLAPTDAFMDRVRERDWRGAERVWRGTRRTAFNDPDMTGKTVYEHALYKMSQGDIDPRFINTRMTPFAHYPLEVTQ